MTSTHEKLVLVWKSVCSISLFVIASACEQGEVLPLPVTSADTSAYSQERVGEESRVKASLFTSSSDAHFSALVFDRGETALDWNAADEASAHEVYRLRIEDVHITPSFENGRCQALEPGSAQLTDSLLAGYSYLGTVFGNRYMDNSTVTGETYRYAIVDVKDPNHRKLVATDLDIHVQSLNDAELRVSSSTTRKMKAPSMQSSKCIEVTPVRTLSIDKKADFGESLLDRSNPAGSVNSKIYTAPTLKIVPPAQTWNAPLLAFPGATGYAKNASGGRGGAVVVVNTLQNVVDPNDGLISLREALEHMDFPRIITFSVGGLFDTGTETIMMDESNSHATIACQTAPSPGVNIKGNGIRIHRGAQNIIMRFCTLRNIDPGTPDSGASRAIGIVGTSGAVNNLVFDHLSISWATDENWTVFTGPSTQNDSANITLSNSIIAEGDADSSHYESGKLPNRYTHSMGPSCNSASDTYRINGCSIINNFIAHNARRNPLMWGVSGEVLNNIIYNWHESGLDARPLQNDLLEIYVVGNEFREGPTTKANNNSVTLLGTDPKSKHVKENNILVKYPSMEVVNLPNASSGQPTQAMSELKNFDLHCVGASRPVRDAIDQRVISEYIAGSGEVGISFNHMRDYSTYAESSAWGTDYDRDGDGMADQWEKINGLDPSNGLDHSLDPDGDGYTNIEEYINELGSCNEPD